TFPLSSLVSLTDPHPPSFFGNLYNALIMHANPPLVTNPAAELREREAVAGGGVTGSDTAATGATADAAAAAALALAIQKRSDFYSGRSGAVYRIAGVDFSPDDLEHAILRTNLPHPSQPPSSLSFLPPTDPRAQLSVSRPAFDCRIHFILNCGAASCPPIKILTPELVETAFAAAAAAYLSSEVAVENGPQKRALGDLVDRSKNGSNGSKGSKRVVFTLASDPVLESGEEGEDGEEVEVWGVEYNVYDWTLNNSDD
ncbi:hypothetical protein B484DRAFT_395481, partial [Ochromonadaceae sp. CCMP2298]